MVLIYNGIAGSHISTQYVMPRNWTSLFTYRKMEAGSAGTNHAATMSQIALRELITLFKGKYMAMNRSAAMNASVRIAALMVHDEKNACNLHRIVPGQPVIKSKHSSKWNEFSFLCYSPECLKSLNASQVFLTAESEMRRRFLTKPPSAAIGLSHVLNFSSRPGLWWS